jgi:hypothetical protein
VKSLSIGALCLAMTSLSGCGAEADPSWDEAASENMELGAASAALQRWGGSTPGSCLDRCLSLCPVDSHGGIEAGCMLTCLAACSPRATLAARASAITE